MWLGGLHQYPHQVAAHPHLVALLQLQQHKQKSGVHAAGQNYRRRPRMLCGATVSQGRLR